MPGFEAFLRRPPFDGTEPVERMLTGAGCQAVQTVTHQVETVYGSPEQWWAACRSQAPWAISWRHIPPARLDAARRAAFTVLDDLARARRHVHPHPHLRLHHRHREGDAMTKSALPIRSALETLQLEFPEYRISQRVIGDRLFYVAEAADPGVQPVFAQAETVDRLRAKLRIPEADISAEVPSIARVYDFLLGGKNNFDADRKQADKVLEVYPHAAELAVQARQFQARAVTYVAQQGIRQFLDVGCGLPTAPNTHQTAQAIAPDARVVYVDNDAQVLSHARNLLAKAPGVLAVAGDLAYPAEILYDWRTRTFLDFHQPLCLILAMTMHFFPPDQAGKITAELTGALPPGSYVIMSVVGGDAELGRGHGPHLHRRAGLQPRPRRPGALPAGPGHHRPRHRRGPALARPGVRARPPPGPRLGRRRPQTTGTASRGGAAVTGDPGVTLESLDLEWGDAYLICYARDQWAALRRDTRRFLTAETLDELATRIEADYAAHPVPRDCDPPGTADYLGTPDEDDEPGRGRGTWPRTRERDRAGRGWGCWPGCGRCSRSGPSATHRFPGPGSPAKTAPPSARTRPRCCASADADRGQTTPGPARPGLAPGVRWLAR